MYNIKRPDKTTLHSSNTTEGETIEAKVRRVLNNKEPIKDGAPIVHTERKDGVLPQYDIRTDRFEVAIDAVDKRTANHLAARDERLKSAEEQSNNTTKPGEPGTKDTTQPTS